MNKKIIVAKDNAIAYDYLSNNFASVGIKFKIKKSTLFNFILVELDASMRDIYLNILAKAVIISHKYKVLIDTFKEVEWTYAKVACLASILYFDIDGEIDTVIPAIADEDTISVEGIFDFKLPQIREDWEELKSIGQVLIYGDSDEDIYNVINFMMTGRTDGKSLFLAQYPDILLANVSEGVMVDSVKFYQNDDFNLINNVIAESPVELIVEKNQLKKSLLDCLSKIVKVKIL